MVRYRVFTKYPHYRVGTDGSVWCNRIHRGTERMGAWKKMKPWPGGTYSNGLMIGFYENHVRKVFRMGPLVLRAFVGPKPKGMECCHEDGNSYNNKLTNLRWDTSKNNRADKNRHGTHNKGERHGMCRLTEPLVEKIIRLLKKGKKLTNLARRFHVGVSTINDIDKERTWTHLPR